MIQRGYTYAVIGASADQEKYGYKVLKDFHDAAYTVYPVNPKGGEIIGLSVYQKLSDIEEQIDVVIFVVPPMVTEKILSDVKDLGITKVWMQPGSESDAAIAFCESHNIACTHHACIMILRKDL